MMVLCVVCFQDAEAKKRRRSGGRKRYTGPPPTHPVVLWSKTLAESTDQEQRKVAAFKLSQYSQTIYQESIVNNLIKCMKDTDTQIKVLCAKAMQRAGNAGQADWVRKAMLETYNADPTLHNTLVRAFTVRKDNKDSVHDTFLKALKNTEDEEERLALLGYFEEVGIGNQKFVDTLVEVYQKTGSSKLQRAVVEALANRAQGQDAVASLMATCAVSKDTPLALNCLSGLQSQARKDPRVWPAVTKTVESSDPDVLMATLDVINAMPESPKKDISSRLVDIVGDFEDSEIQEKAILALGVCGDHSEPVVKALQKTLDDNGMDEGVRIAAALVMGKQAESFPELPKTSLTQCVASTKSQNLKTACQLGLQELATRQAIAEKNQPSATAAKTETERETTAANTENKEEE